MWRRRRKGTKAKVRGPVPGVLVSVVLFGVVPLAVFERHLWVVEEDVPEVEHFLLVWEFHLEPTERAVAGARVDVVSEVVRCGILRWKKRERAASPGVGDGGGRGRVEVGAAPCWTRFRYDALLVVLGVRETNKWFNARPVEVSVQSGHSVRKGKLRIAVFEMHPVAALQVDGQADDVGVPVVGSVAEEPPRALCGTKVAAPLPFCDLVENLVVESDVVARFVRPFEHVFVEVLEELHGGGKLHVAVAVPFDEQVGIVLNDEAVQADGLRPGGRGRGRACGAVSAAGWAFEGGVASPVERGLVAKWPRAAPHAVLGGVQRAAFGVASVDHLSQHGVSELPWRSGQCARDVLVHFFGVAGRVLQGEGDVRMWKAEVLVLNDGQRKGARQPNPS